MSRICTFCVMDDTDPEIEFDARGECNHCRTARHRLRVEQFIDADDARLRALANAIKTDGSGKEYDCVMGVSGGVDSTYALLVAAELGLRPLAVHLDNGWNTKLAVGNIERTITHLNIDLHTHVVD